MADASVSMVLNRLAPIIEKRVREEVCLLLNSNKEAETLYSKLKKIQQVLMEAEQEGVKNPEVKSWLEKLQDISYDIDEVVDEWELDNLKSQLEDASESSDTIWEKVSYFLQSLCLCFKQCGERRRIALNVKQLNERIDLIAQDNEKDFNFIPNLSHDSPDFKPSISTSIADVSEVIGRDDDLKTLMDNLLKNKGEDDIQIVSIVGPGGMGKTTLAQLAFNDDIMKTQFDVKIWVCVSDPFDEIKIAKAILEALGGSSPNLSQLETLLQRIKDSISEKRFLLVLDDVWTENDTMWKPLKTSLIKNGAPGSRILLTTRNRKVAEIMGSRSTLTQSLAELSDSHCWSILSEKAFNERSDGDREMLKKTGLEIAKKCKGLPLAARTMGSLLQFKTSLQEWQNVLGSDMWESDERKTDLFHILALSYNDLRPAVKRCFSYCAIFPKDFQIDVYALIRIWMSQGFLSSDGTVGDMEIKGREYFQELAMRSFFQDFGKDERDDNLVKYCKMHDIIHDFAQFLTKNECLIVERVAGEAEEERVSGQKARHLNVEAKITMDNLYSISPIKKLCSLFCTQRDVHMDLLSHLKRVRLLSLRSCNLLDIPSEIGNLIHLRYLDLRYNTLLKKLPETICDLYNLQTLDLIDCQSLIGLPQEIHKLVNLRHLLVDFTPNEFRFNGGFGKLKNLRTLDYFYCGKEVNKLGYLKDLNQLEGSIFLRIGDLSDDSEVIEAEKADLKSKKFIQYLALEYTGEVELRIMDALQPPPSLSSLRILCCGSPLPKWIATLTSLRMLTIDCCVIEAERWHSISNIPFLEKLTMTELKMKHLGLEFLGINKTAAAKQTVSAFPKLKILKFRLCLEWEEWEDISEEYANSGDHISILPCLEELEICCCVNLKSLPHRLLRMASSLKKLDLLGSSDTLIERFRKASGRDWDQISHFQYVRNV